MSCTNNISSKYVLVFLNLVLKSMHLFLGQSTEYFWSQRASSHLYLKYRCERRGTGQTGPFTLDWTYKYPKCPNHRYLKLEQSVWCLGCVFVDVKLLGCVFADAVKLLWGQQNWPVMPVNDYDKVSANTASLVPKNTKFQSGHQVVKWF